MKKQSLLTTAALLACITGCAPVPLTPGNLAVNTDSSTKGPVGYSIQSLVKDTKTCEKCDLEVTGGGFVEKKKCPKDDENNNKVTFGFVAHFTDDNSTPSGEIEVNDHTTGFRYHGTVNSIVCLPNNCVQFSGTLTDTNDPNFSEGDAFTTQVCDNNEPGTSDTFGFQVDSTFIVPFGTVLGGGNIQIHPTH